jgi:hypothetical protein
VDVAIPLGYMQTCENVSRNTATDYARWHVRPADLKWFTRPRRAVAIGAERARSAGSRSPLYLNPLLVGIDEIHKALDVIALRQPRLFLPHLQARLQLGIVLPGVV